MKFIVTVVLVIVIAAVGYVIWNAFSDKAGSSDIGEKTGNAIDTALDKSAAAVGTAKAKTGDVLEKTGAALKK